jgi:predicted aconitase
MKLTTYEQSMLNGKGRQARQKAMELWCAMRTRSAQNASSPPTMSPAFRATNAFAKYYQHKGGGGYDAIFSFSISTATNWCSASKAGAHTCHLQGGFDPDNWQILGATPESFKISQESEAFIAGRGVQILKTCTPYLAGNVPKKGDHCAWMESSAVVYCNSVLAARTNTEGRESTSAAMPPPASYRTRFPSR